MSVCPNPQDTFRTKIPSNNFTSCGVVEDFALFSPYPNSPYVGLDPHDTTELSAATTIDYKDKIRQHFDTLPCFGVLILWLF